MNLPELIDLWRGCLTTASLVAGPLLLAALTVGVATSLLQAATQIQENVTSFVPKLIGVGLVLAVGGHFLLGKLTQYTSETIKSSITMAQRNRQ